jgi:Na+/melibiose symporter-like transporter
MNILQKLIYGREPKTAIIKRKAHLFTLLAILWSAFSVMAVTFIPNRDHGSKMGWFLILGVWAANLTWMLLSVYFWITEKPKDATIKINSRTGLPG